MSIFKHQNLSIDFNTQLILLDNEEFKLDLKAFTTLKLLFDNSERIVETEEIVEHVWSENLVNYEVVTSAIARIRKLFKQAGIEEEAIKTIHKVGYQFVIENQADNHDFTQFFSENSKSKGSLFIIGIVAATLIGFMSWYLLTDTISTPLNQPENSYQVNSFNNSHTTVYFIRHADKQDPDAEDPKLSDLGIKRAEYWRNLLRYIEFDNVFTTKYIRNIQTAEIVSDEKATIYHPMSFDIIKHVKENSGSTMLIVGHSNTIPDMVNRLVGRSQFPPMSHQNYNLIYQIIIDEEGSISTQLFNVEFEP